MEVFFSVDFPFPRVLLYYFFSHSTKTTWKLENSEASNQYVYAVI